MNVAAWLQGLGLGQYEQAFRANDLDGEILADLTADDLTLQLLFWDVSESMGNHDSEVVDASSVD
jgi:hypothetical protein